MKISISLPVIYKITNNINGKVYIGQTVDFDRRMNEYKNRKPNKSSKYNIMHIINTYGFDNFTFEIIHTCKSDSELDLWEYFYINEYKSYDPAYGYNSKHLDTNGDEICNKSTRQKMSKSHIGLTESAVTKKKKSKPVIAVSDTCVCFCDSAKLFADYIGTSRAVISHARRDCHNIRGYYIFSADKDTRNNIISNNTKYNIIRKMLNEEDVETIKTHHKVKYLQYTDEK